MRRCAGGRIPFASRASHARRALPLDENEGVYVRDLLTGKVRAVVGSTYMLAPDEELWRKELPAEVERLLETQALGAL